MIGEIGVHLNKFGYIAVMMAVITGYIVSSKNPEKVGTEDQFMRMEENLTQAFREMVRRGWLKQQDYIMYRGNRFQCLVPGKNGLEAAILLKAALKGGITKNIAALSSYSWRCRLAVGLGEVTYRAGHISTSNGPAFQRSGRTLDTLGRNRFTAVSTPWPETQEELDLLCRYFDIITERLWTQVSAQTVWHYLRKEQTQEELARTLGISQPAVHRRIHGAELQAIEETIHRYHSIIKSNNQ